MRIELAFGIFKWLDEIIWRAAGDGDRKRRLSDKRSAAWTLLDALSDSVGRMPFRRMILIIFVEWACLLPKRSRSVLDYNSKLSRSNGLFMATS